MSAAPRPLRAEVVIDAPASKVWQVVSDPKRTPEWSQECRRVVTVGSPRVGRWVLGFNRRKAVVWATVSKITALEVDHQIAWVVLTNRSVWTYRIASIDGGTQLIETRETPRGESTFALWFTRILLGGQHAHDDELEVAMADGLQVVKRLVEATG